MARTRLFDLLRRAATLAHGAGSSGRDADETRAETEARWQLSRRSFLQTSAATAALASMPSALAGCADDAKASGSSVAIVGAGMAGLHCALRLKDAGVHAQILDAATRVGGRMFTARGMFADGQLCELGGELIDTGHTNMRALAMRFGIALDDLTPETGIRRDTFYVGGRIVPESEIVEAFTPLAAVMAQTVMRAEMDDAYFATVDAMSIDAWLDAQPEATPLAKQLLRAAYVSEYGLETDDQSVFNLLYLIDYENPDPFTVYGESDERFHVHLGNDALTTAMANELSGQIELGMRLTKVASTPGGLVRLTFQRDGGTVERDYEHVVLALPFTLLREVDLPTDWPAEKLEVIAELGYGTNAKLMGQFTSRHWESTHHASGSIIADTSLQTTWDTSRGQSGASGLLTNFVGGRAGLSLGDGTAEERMMAALPMIDAVFPGTSEAYRANSAVRMHWPTAPFMKGSYASYRVGQWAMQGQEIARVGNVHFAGEHCSADYQGFMEGAAETGAAAAMEVLEDLGLASHAEALRVLAPNVAPGIRSPAVRRRLVRAWRAEYVRRAGR